MTNAFASLTTEGMERQADTLGGGKTEEELLYV